LQKEERHESYDEQGRGVVVKGEHDMVVHFAKCCTPVPGDEIFGYITRGRGVSIHRSDCPNAEQLLMDVERIIPVEWVTGINQTFPVTIHVISGERAGIMMEITQLLLSMRVNTKYLNAKSGGDTVDITLTFDIQNAEQLQNITRSIMKLDSVIKVERSNQV
ncbi:MAG: bifunctional (p)ppGpp synthetase/guanosine-3',5'-bis(diphosphate) 3'-pyrophosphohydrolase, partial [Clostridia bacterium]|nr:bifunctional (p)ppGpp synthetase/guanosine-3',5'-bis(diphosphate) 3'-pyrophosphohydrolase [Clostridia bacterium]